MCFKPFKFDFCYSQSKYIKYAKEYKLNQILQMDIVLKHGMLWSM